MSPGIHYYYKLWGYATDGGYTSDGTATKPYASTALTADDSTNTNPVQSNQLIWDGSAEKSLNATDVAVPPTSFNITISDTDGDKMNITVKTNESGTWQVVNQTGGSGLSNGTYSFTNVSWVDSYSTTYYISFNVTDGTDWANETFKFTTIANYTTPTISNPSPSDNATDVNPNPVLSVKCIDLDGDTMNAAWWWNDSGTWKQFATNTSLSNNTIITQSNSNFSSYNTTYQWAVNLTDGTDYVNNSYTFTTRNQYIPGPPSSFTATNVSTSQINLAWTKNSSADTTYIERNTSISWNRGEGTLIYNGTGTSYSDTGLNSNTTYYYRAWSYNATDNIYSTAFSSDNATTAESSTTYTIDDIMNLLQSPLAQYTYDIQGCNIKFYENAFDWNGYITNYTWDFGDGNISYEQNPLHSYNSVGYYNVTLTVTDDESKSSNVTHIINVTSACPFPPLLISPKNNSNDVNKDVLLSVYVYDPSDSPMTVTFYQYNATGNDTVIGTCNGISGQEASIVWKGRTVGQTYQWYAMASDGTHNATSGIFSFTVSETQINVSQTAFYGGLILFIGMAAIG
ncbi:MAG: PKD domain-containing protein, partial [Candidatus Thorarchaeota archaeon]